MGKRSPARRHSCAMGAGMECEHRRGTGQRRGWGSLLAGCGILLATASACSTARPQAAAPLPPPIAVAPAPPQPELPPYIPWGEHTVATRLTQFGTAARTRWQPWFEQAGVPYPGNAIVLVGLKREQRLLVYSGPSWGRLAYVRDFAWTATSGGPGPKRREGDKQIPEGIYAIESLNPNSRFHVSLRLDYPNRFDRSVAAREGRTGLGGDIMIHGGNRSIGCVAVGDEAAEDLFVLAADAGLEVIDVVLAPHDLRHATVSSRERDQIPWVRQLYARLDAALQSLPPATITTVRR